MAQVKKTISHWYHQMDNIFSEPEAWSFFKITAILETIGWTLLIIGITFKVYHWPFSDWALALGGSSHGMIVIAYMFIVFFVHRSLDWSVRRLVVAELINAVPYGVLCFEIWAERKRRRELALQEA